MWVLVLQRITIQFLFDLVYFPLWWYTGGTKHTGLFCFDLLRRGNARLAPGLWLRNIYVPMFGQYDWQGRLVSFFMRLMNVIIRTILLFFWLNIVIIIFALWLVFPLFVVVMLVNSFF